ncbi:MAG: hypothetical protein A2622_07875 [Bdellovibrionales bacterium RIFCSPHIGHO2_01_FULL_40_29]|nr:MAG: hypothetical protein A2622_07875 [Bdellovibrionales bacterium RIFCSPHIGHO2_01_FULL_40_29]OFZ33724.1 MAG: hypothetical protein A3D17_09965 [Bdellovibrionales bacterium RIFCSPHIGHO2_02_FULL_40_15]
MKKIILTLTALLLTVTASAGTSDIGSADGTKRFECKLLDYNIKIAVTDNRIIKYVTNGELGAGQNLTPVSTSADGLTEYSFPFYDYADTNYFIVVEILNNKLVSAIALVSGNDSDNYLAVPTTETIVCNTLK